MTLLELDEKEMEILQAALIKERTYWEERDPKEVSGTLIRNVLSICKSIESKVNEASKPQPEVLITFKDLFDLKSSAKSEYVQLNGNLNISKKEVEKADFVHISLTNALILWLNRNNLLKKLVKFDFTDNSFEYESMED